MPKPLPTIEEAAHAVVHARRISVIGCSAGGKSTLSQALARRLGLPYISMDKAFYWLPGWRKRDKVEELAMIVSAVAGERWVMDGTGTSSFHLRMPRTDVVLWIRLPRRQCLIGLASRVMRSYGRVREDMAQGCPEQWPDREFLGYIWNFEQQVSPIIERQMAAHGPDVPIFTLKTRRDVARLLDLIPAAN